VSRQGTKGLNATEIKKMSGIESLQAMVALWDSLIDKSPKSTPRNSIGTYLKRGKERLKKVKQNSFSLEKLRAKGGQSPAGYDDTVTFEIFSKDRNYLRISRDKFAAMAESL